MHFSSSSVQSLVGHVPKRACVSQVLWTDVQWPARADCGLDLFPATPAAPDIVFIANLSMSFRLRYNTYQYYNILAARVASSFIGSAAVQHCYDNVTWRDSWKNRISSTTVKLRKSLVKPVTWQKTCNYNELFGSSARDRHAGRS